MARTRTWKNQLITGLVRLFRAPRSPSPLERLLVVSTTALGDTLWATPALANLRLRYPNARIDVLTSPVGHAVLQHNPSLSHLYLLPQLTRALPLLRTLTRTRYDAALLFHASQRLALPLCALSQIPRLIGTAGHHKGLDGLLTDPVAPLYEHEIERRLRLAALLDAPRTVETLSYTVLPAEREEARAFLNTAKPVIAFHPGSKEPFRRWPPRCFAAVGQALQSHLDCEILLTGTPAEEPLLREIQRLLPQARLAPPRGSVRQLAALLEQTSLLLSNDTGPFHLACALNRPTVGLYVSTDPLLCGPHKARRARTLSRSPTCTPCLKKRCQEAFCFLQIPPSEVIDACLGAIAN